MKLPSTREEWEIIVKEWGWTAAAAVFVLLICWQGLTLRRDLQSWQQLENRTKILTTGEYLKGKSKHFPVEKNPDLRVVEATFFYHPSSEYNLTAILGDYAVINGQEVRVGGRIEKAVVKEIEPNSVTLLEDGKQAPTKIELYPGL